MLYPPLKRTLDLYTISFIIIIEVVM
jgi:hypothetical protein